MKIFMHLLVSTLAIIIATYLIPGVTITIWGALVLAVVLGIINVFIKPVVKMIALPLTILTLGIFSLVINALFVLLAGKIVPGFSVAGFWTAFWFSIVLSLINAFFNFFQRSNTTVNI
jgi:putative membrane protein